MKTNINYNLIDKYIEEYKIFLKYLPKNFIEQQYLQFIHNYNSGINPDIYFGLYIQNKVNLELCKSVKNGNIDLEIELINKYMPILDLICRKLNYQITDKEGILIASFESYNGDKLLSQHITNVLKNHKVGKTIEPVADKPIDFEDSIQIYLKNNIIIPTELSDLGGLFIKLNVVNFPTDELLKKYMFLKFGYYNDICFSDCDIMNILNINYDNIVLMNKECLKLLKNIVKESIDLAILYSNKYLNFNKPYEKIITKKQL